MNEKTADEKTMEELLAEEEKKLVDEVNEKVKKMKSLLKSDEPEKGFQDLKKS
jgi:negative regulator of replication initiation